MGGATSKFEETDWTLADGKLTVSDIDAAASGSGDATASTRTGTTTIDGAPPTRQFQVYYLIKKGVNQREFDITDEENNLLYTTKAVAGTIACFDVSIFVRVALCVCA